MLLPTGEALRVTTWLHHHEASRNAFEWNRFFFIFFKIYIYIFKGTTWYFPAAFGLKISSRSWDILKFVYVYCVPFTFISSPTVFNAVIFIYLFIYYHGNACGCRNHTHWPTSPRRGVALPGSSGLRCPHVAVCPSLLLIYFVRGMVQFPLRRNWISRLRLALTLVGLPCTVGRQVTGVNATQL